MDKIKKYAIPIALVILGFLAGWFLKPSKENIQVANKTEIVYKDTCLTNNLLCTITSKDSMSIYRIVKEGLKSKSERVFPKVESSKEIKDAPKEIRENTYTKYMNNGYTEVWDTLIIHGELKDWKRATKANEVIEVQEKHTQTTAVVEKGKDDSFQKKTEYIPVEVKPSYLKLLGGISYTDKVFYPVGAGISWKGLEMSLTKNIKAPGGNINLSIPLIKLKD